jgi:hypothetical protein
MRCRVAANSILRRFAHKRLRCTANLFWINGSAALLHCSACPRPTGHLSGSQVATRPSSQCRAAALGTAHRGGGGAQHWTLALATAIASAYFLCHTEAD